MIARVILVCLHENQKLWVESGNIATNNVDRYSAHSRDKLGMAMKFNMITSVQVYFVNMRKLCRLTKHAC